jgi:DNA-binding protein H-NS
MHAFREFQAELEKLHQQSERSRRIERAAAVERIRALIADCAILPEELARAWEGTAHAPPAARATATTPKYRDPATGATWSGRGRAPKWLVGADRSRFEVR